MEYTYLEGSRLAEYGSKQIAASSSHVSKHEETRGTTWRAVSKSEMLGTLLNVWIYAGLV
jgi:hypothetical protein